MLCVYEYVHENQSSALEGGLYNLANKPICNDYDEIYRKKWINPTYTNLTQPIHFYHVRLYIS